MPSCRAPSLITFIGAAALCATIASGPRRGADVQQVKISAS